MYKRIDCQSCRYWVSYNDTRTKGACHRYPPSDSPNKIVTEISFHINTNRGDWCGEGERECED